jgi:hypothetical protein
MIEEGRYSGRGYGFATKEAALATQRAWQEMTVDEMEFYGMISVYYESSFDHTMQPIFAYRKLKDQIPSCQTFVLKEKETNNKQLFSNYPEFQEYLSKEIWIALEKDALVPINEILQSNRMPDICEKIFGEITRKYKIELTKEQNTLTVTHPKMIDSFKIFSTSDFVGEKYAENVL